MKLANKRYHIEICPIILLVYLLFELNAYSNCLILKVALNVLEFSGYYLHFFSHVLCPTLCLFNVYMHVLC